MTRAWTVMLVAALALVAPASAHATTTFTWTPQELKAANDGAGGSVSLYTRTYTQGDAEHTFPAFSVSGPYVIDNVHCVEDAGYVVCDGADTIRLEGGGGQDFLNVGDEPALLSVPIATTGGGGNDRLQDFSPAGRTLDGGPGDDVLWASRGDDTLDGGSGNDEVDGDAGNDTVRGGDGDDLVYGDHFAAQGADLIDGGPGTDRVDDWSGNADATVTLDGAANDGRPGESDNVVAVETIEGPPGSYTGSDAAETFDVGASGRTTRVSALGGNDTITTNNGPDTIDGGAGADRIVAGHDNDTITGGPGPDTIFADSTGSYCGIYSCTIPFGNDTINARDGEADQIDCGIGADRAVTDTIDTVANCETVEAAKQTDGGGQGGGGPAGGGLAVLSKLSIKRIARSGLRIRVACPAACKVSANLTTARALARTLRLGSSRRLASGRKTLLAAGNATVTLKVSRKAVRRFRRLRKATVQLNVAVTGADGKITRLGRRLRLKR